MWLLNASSYMLEEFYEAEVPPYAILSHRWQANEVKFKKDIQVLNGHHDSQGQRKVISCCQQAIKDGLAYVWIDTCCIDKASSAELSEAINSMYRWYEAARVCYAYLFDVDGIDTFESSTWFTRSWTLQELLAPVEVIFFNENWESMGMRSDETVCQRLSSSTKIPEEAIRHFDVDAWCIAEKLSWASKRKATRIEDVAYSLLGLFDANMPLLYGEGDKAFFRLQQVIMQTTRDASLFFWVGKSSKRFGMLATSPGDFDYDLLRAGQYAYAGFRYQKLPAENGYTVNNAGMSIELFLRPLFLQDNLQGIYAASLTSERLFRLDFKQACFFLEQQEKSNRYRRVLVNGKAWAIPMHSSHEFSITQSRNVLIRKACSVHRPDSVAQGFLIKGSPQGLVLYRQTRSLRGTWSPRPYEKITADENSEISLSIDARSSYGMLGHLTWEETKSSARLVAYLGFDFDYNPICLAYLSEYIIGIGFTHEPGDRRVMSDFIRIMSTEDGNGVGHDGEDGVYCFRGLRRGSSYGVFPDLHLEFVFEPAGNGQYRCMLIRTKSTA